MGLVTEALIDQIKDQVERRRTVVWFDPEREYVSVAESLELPETDKYLYSEDQGFLSLRRQLETLWSGEEVPRLLVYIPLAEEETHHSLAEYSAVGAVLAPGRQPPKWNTKLAVVTRSALLGICPDASIQAIVNDIEAGKLTLSDVEVLAENCVELEVSALKLVFDTGNPEDILLLFLADRSYDTAITERGLEGEVAQLLGQALGHELASHDDLDLLRPRAQRFVLSNEFLDLLIGDTPENLASLPRPANAAARQTIRRIAEAWRQRRDLSASYAEAADRVAGELRIANLGLSVEALEHVETFRQVDTALQHAIEDALVKGSEASLGRIVRERSVGYWAKQDPIHTLRWRLIDDMSRLLEIADGIEKELKVGPRSPAELISGYTQVDHPWSALDTVHRHLERDVHHFDFDVQEHEGLLRLIAIARQRYAQIAGTLAESFTHALEESKFEIPGVGLQMQIFRETVSPNLQSGKTAYLLVDALRYEMASELLEQLKEDWRVDLGHALASVPTITSVGMAALMPGADNGVIVKEVGGGNLAGEVRGVTLKTREDRMKHLAASVEGQVAITELTSIAPLTSQGLRRKIEEANLVIVTATDEIDGLWEQNPALARGLHEHVFEQLRRGIRTLFGLGIKTAIVVSDHGFLFGERLASGDLIDPPGGQKVDLHRRVWVGRGGAEVPGCVRAPLSAFGMGGDLEVVSPYGLACFKVPGGSMEYFHGGLSLQEMIIPVLKVEPIAMPVAVSEPAFSWIVTFGSDSVTTRFFSVNVAGEGRMLFDEPPKVKAELRHEEATISEQVSATYGFSESTREVELRFGGEGSKEIRLNTITLQVLETAEIDHVAFHLIDAETGLTLWKKERIPLDIAY